MRDDPLSAARGCAVGLVLSALAWLGLWLGASWLIDGLP